MAAKYTDLMSLTQQPSIVDWIGFSPLTVHEVLLMINFGVALCSWPSPYGTSSSTGRRDGRRWHSNAELLGRETHHLLIDLFRLQISGLYLPSWRYDCTELNMLMDTADAGSVGSLAALDRSIAPMKDLASKFKISA